MLDQIVQYLTTAQSAVTDNGGTIASVLGVLFVMAKAVSTEKAVPVVSLVQKALDGAASVASKVGDLLHSGADMLANLLKSDGTLGKK